MAGSLLDALVESVPLIARGIGAVLAAVVGASVEVSGLNRLVSDPTLLGGWVMWIGVLLLFASYLLASDVTQRFRAPTAS